MQIIGAIIIIVNIYIIFNLLMVIGFTIVDKLKPKSNFRINEFPNFSILIPAHNEEKVIGKTLRSLLSTKYVKKLQIIVIAHNCTDKTYDIAKQYNVTVIKSTEGTTKGDALNYGVRYARYDWIGVIDSDSNVGEYYFTKVAKAISDTKPDACQTQVRIINKTNFLTHMTDFEFLVAGFIRQYIFSKFHFAVLGGNGQFIKKKVLEDVGFWSNNLADDTELTIRLLRAQYKVHFYNDIEIYQQAIDTLKGFFNQRTRWCQGNTSLLPRLLMIKPFQGLNIFFNINGILLSPIVKISNILLIIYIVTNTFNANPLYILPYFLLLLTCCIRYKQNPLKIFLYYGYTQLMFVVYFKTFIKMVTKNNVWVKTERVG